MAAHCALDAAAGQGRCRLRAVVTEACCACQTVNATARLVSSKSWFCVEVNERHCTCLSRAHTRGVWLSYQQRRRRGRTTTNKLSRGSLFAGASPILYNYNPTGARSPWCVITVIPNGSRDSALRMKLAGTSGRALFAGPRSAFQGTQLSSTALFTAAALSPAPWKNSGVFLRATLVQAR